MKRVMPYESEGLWLKARLFMNRAMDSETRQFEEAAFWACCALELLGKCALSRVNPALIAYPNDDGKSMLIATGISDDPAQFISVQAKTVWARCSKAFPQFHEPEAKELSLGRNSYIHSAAMGFDVIPADEWWPRFWALANVLVAHCDSTIDDLVGPTRAELVQAELEKNRANIERRLKALVENAQLRLRLHQSGSMAGLMAREWARFNPEVWVYTGEAPCPACGESADIGGDEIESRDLHHEEGPHGWDVGVTLTVATYGLSCDNCHFELSEPDLLDAAGVPEAFETEGSLDDVADLYEAEYNNE